MNGQYQSKHFPCSDWTGTAPDQTSSDWASQFIPDNLGPDIQAQTRHPSSEPTASDDTAPRGTFKPRPDSHKLQTSRLRPSSLRPDRPAQTRHSSSHRTATASDQTFQLSLGSFRPAKLRLDSFRPDIPAQIGKHEIF